MKDMHEGPWKRKSFLTYSFMGCATQCSSMWFAAERKMTTGSSPFSLFAFMWVQMCMQLACYLTVASQHPDLLPSWWMVVLAVSHIPRDWGFFFLPLNAHKETKCHPSASLLDSPTCQWVYFWELYTSLRQLPCIMWHGILCIEKWGCRGKGKGGGGSEGVCWGNGNILKHYA